MLPETRRHHGDRLPSFEQMEELALEVEQMLVRISEGWRMATAARGRIARIKRISASAGAARIERG